jgi:hypothetical protein
MIREGVTQKIGEHVSFDREHVVDLGGCASACW